MWHVWGGGEVHTRFWWGNLRQRDHLEDLGIDGRILKRTENKYNWRDLVNMLMNLGVPYNAGNFLTS
jgi:hypothetical protein